MKISGSIALCLIHKDLVHDCNKAKKALDTSFTLDKVKARGYTGVPFRPDFRRGKANRQDGQTDCYGCLVSGGREARMLSPLIRALAAELCAFVNI